MIGGLSVEMLLWTAGVPLVLAAVIKCVWSLLTTYSFCANFRTVPQEPDFSWVWGNVHLIKNLSPEDKVNYTDQLTFKFPKLCIFWYGPFNPVVFIHHPDTIKPITKIAGPKTPFYDYGLPWLGEGLLIAKGARWARARRLLTPAFHYDTLKPYVDLSNRGCDILLNKIQVSVDKKKSIEMFSNISLCTLDIILQCAMSYKDDFQLKGESHPYVKAVAELTELWEDRIRNPWLRSDAIYFWTSEGRKFKRCCDFAHSIADDVIRARQESLARDGPPEKRYLDFLDVLLMARDENGNGLTAKEIRDEVDTFMFEGHDTTASAITWTLYSLAKHPGYQRKVQAELDLLMEGRESQDITWADLSKLDFLTLVIKEGIRLHSPVPSVGRQLTEPLSLEGITFPQGTFCFLNLISIHHNPTVWEDPLTFRPERFLPENMKDKDSHAFIGFSAGPRNCIGQHFAMNEMKVVLGRLLARFDFSLDDSHKVERHAAAVMRAQNGIFMFATPRASGN